jgi:hypothetical protein
VIALLLAAQLALGSVVTDAELAAMQSEIESDNDPAATACPSTPAARTARLYYDDPSYATPGAPCYCGLWQTTATSPAMCRAQRDPVVGYATWKAERAAWRRVCVLAMSRRRIAREDNAETLEICVIAGYAVGGDGVTAALGGKVTPAGRWGVRYAKRLLARAIARRRRRSS